MNAFPSSSDKSHLLLLMLIWGIYCCCKPITHNERPLLLKEDIITEKTLVDSVIDLSNLDGKTTCLPEIVKALQICLRESMGSKRYHQFSVDNGIVSMSISVDTLGNVKHLNSYKLKHISEKEFKYFYQEFLKNIKFCIYVYDRILTQDEILKYNKNNISYTLHIR